MEGNKMLSPAGLGPRKPFVRGIAAGVAGPYWVIYTTTGHVAI